ncbi:MAG: DUF4149 domain-containing protein [Candidatus Solibacter usitatus]|nr:DUF4149 domain-containing protein [Candidatus Solibacter usitatus]
MTPFLNFIEQLSLAVWVGAIVFFTLFTAPVLFQRLNEEDATRIIRILFPRYYLLGTVCSFLVAGVQLARGFLWFWGGMIGLAAAMFLLLGALNLYARQVLAPAINRARDAGPAEKKRFSALHLRSVAINAFTLIACVAYLIWMAGRGY